MAIKRQYINNIDPEEFDKKREEYLRKIANQPEKIEFRQNRDKTARYSGYETKARPEKGNSYYNQAYKDENNDGINRIKNRTKKNRKVTVNELLNKR